MTTTDIKPHADEIRKAFAKGRKTVMLTDDKGVKRKFSIKRVDREPMVHQGGKSTRTMESWLIARPADGSLTPVYNIEPVYQCNLRS